jgi:hypothetical protein
MSGDSTLLPLLVHNYLLKGTWEQDNWPHVPLGTLYALPAPKLPYSCTPRETANSDKPSVTEYLIRQWPTQPLPDPWLIFFALSSPQSTLLGGANEFLSKLCALGRLQALLLTLSNLPLYPGGKPLTLDKCYNFRDLIHVFGPEVLLSLSWGSVHALYNLSLIPNSPTYDATPYKTPYYVSDRKSDTPLQPLTEVEVLQTLNDPSFWSGSALAYLTASIS